MLFGALAAGVVTVWQIAMAAERVRGHARHLAEAVTAEGYGMHHWLHEERVAGTVTAPAEGTARALTAAEAGRLAAHSATARWRRTAADATRPVLPRGWEVVHLVGTAGGLPDGVLVLRPSDEAVALPTWDAARQALDVTLGPSEEGAATLAAIALAASTLDDYDAARDRALPASRFARLDADALLREVHAGHARLAMEAGIRMGGNDLSGVATLQGERGTIPRIDGDCPPSSPGTLSGLLCADSLVLRATLTANANTTLSTATAEDVTVTTDVTGITRIRTQDATVSGSVTTPALTACADPEAARCGGGDLDLEAGTGTPDWSEAAIFGDTVIRDGNRLTGVRRTTGGEGVFGTLGNGSLGVSGCLRVVSPFLHHGAGC
ncbi:MAG: hypothetical protein F4213_13280 [Boseongicola sp. SB0677_bin_26]|nr:hypothetical protein [Boseongicola sp. SB0677_bin_26]